jgi:putative ABC transport system permease protein
MLQDVRFAFRLFARQRGFFATTLLTIALGVALSSTVFAVVDGVLFRPLPYRQPERLVALYGAVRVEDQPTMPVSWPDLIDWRAGSRSFEQIEGYELGNPAARVRGAEESAQVPSSAVTSGLLDMLGTRAALGRTFGRDDFATGAPRAAIISHRIWRTIYGEDPDVLGRTIAQGDVDYTIVGVLPRTFVFPVAGQRFAPDVLMPFNEAERARSDRARRTLFLVGRLAPGATLPQARVEMDAIALRLKPLFNGRPNSRPGALDGVTVRDLRAHLTNATHNTLWLVFGAVIAVFMISCVNVLGLLLAQAEERRRELALRSALGASRRALLRQLLVESSVLAIVGVSMGWLISVATFRAVVGQVPRWLQLLGEPRLDGRAAVFAGLLAILVVVFAGALPALQAAARARYGWAAAGWLSRHSTTIPRGRHVLLLAQVALATVLLCAGTIMLRSWIALYAEPIGMTADRVIAVRAVPHLSTDAASRTRFNASLADAIRRLPGVESVSFVDFPLLQKAMKGSPFVPPREANGSGGMETDVTVTPEYFATMGTPLHSGRTVRQDDIGRAVVINQRLAHRYWPDRSPIGDTIRYGDGQRVIVGVVADARDYSLDRDPIPTLYHPWDETRAPVATIVVRFAGPASRMMASVRRAVRTADDGATITLLSTVEDLLALSVAERNFNTLLLGVFGAAGMALALVGIFGLVSLIVSRREREFGIRMALGANTGGLKVLVVAGTLRWVLAGIGVGIGAALFSAQYLKAIVYKVPENDPTMLAVAAVAFVTVAAVASYVPARRVAHADPLAALRAE